MSILQCLVARNSEIVLSEYTEYIGNFQQVSRALLRKLKKEPNKLSIDYDNYQFHYLRDDNTQLNFLCLTEAVNIEIAFALLNDVLKKFDDIYDLSKVQSASSYQLQEFENEIKILLEYYNSSPKPSISKYSQEKIENSVLNKIENKKIESIFQSEEKVTLVVLSNKTLKKNYKEIDYINKKKHSQQNYKRLKTTVAILVGIIIFLVFIKAFFSNSNSEDKIDTNIINSEYNISGTNNNNITASEKIQSKFLIDGSNSENNNSIKRTLNNIIVNSNIINIPNIGNQNIEIEKKNSF